MIERLIDNFDLLANAPNGVSELRKMILQLAVQGKLVSQDPNDEPAEILLEKIKAEKEKLIKEGKIKKQKVLPPINPDELPYELPSQWAWTRMDLITEKVHYGYTASADHSQQEIRLLRITDIQNDSVDWDSVPGCQIDEKNIADYELNDGDILIARTGGTIGKSYLVTNLDIHSVFASYLIRLVPHNQVLPEYIKVFLGSSHYWRQLYESSMGTGQPNVNGTSLRSLYVSLPPFAEQKRIVAKVDQLMALCDELESKQQEYNEKRLSVNASCLHSLTTASKKTQPAAEKRLFNNFDNLYTHPQTVSELKKAILQLAVQGNLVPQDPNDEPAEILLEKIKTEKEKLIKEGKIKKQKPLPPINPDELPYELPKQWAWTRMDLITEKVHYGYTASADHSQQEILLLRITDIQNDSVNWDSVPGCQIDENNITDYELNNGDILIARTGGTIGKSYLVTNLDRLSVFASYLIRLVPYNQVLPEYIKVFLGSQHYWRQLYESSMGTGQPNVNGTSLRRLYVSLPPLEEQKRIVAKVDQLMALCDELEARLSQAQEESESLAASIVYHLCDQVTTEEVTS